jgi:hypothetical protein
MGELLVTRRKRLAFERSSEGLEKVYSRSMLRSVAAVLLIASRLLHVGLEDSRCVGRVSRFTDRRDALMPRSPESMDE